MIKHLNSFQDDHLNRYYNHEIKQDYEGNAIYSSMLIEYVNEKYGKDSVTQITTFGTMAARGVIRDVGRVLDMPYAQVDVIAKMIPNELNITIEKALVMNPEFKQLYDSDEQVQYLIDMCKRLEGLPRHTSMHAAGVVICPKAADEFVPLSRGSDGSITTQFTMTTLEELGLLKMDFLGLRTLTVIQNAVNNIQKEHGITVDVDTIDYDDKAVLASIGTGRTDGIFQLESGGMKNFMKELKPQNLEDIIAGISLYRPGPMDFIPKYIKGKDNHQAITYSCPQLEPILSATYGCIVYQEQVMQIVRDLGGYTLGRSDLVRRAMSKKKQAVMEKERANFIYGNAEENVPGCVAIGISEEVAGQIYGDMMDFAKYAFNKSHAACYAVVAYQTAYLKYYYPVEFMAALMTSVIDNPGKVSEYILSCRQMGIEILPPDINKGEAGFSVAGKAIRYALTAVKGVGRPVIDSIVKERKRRGNFTNLQDFITRDEEGNINKRVIENFIKAGAFDSFGGTRKQFMSVYVQIMDHVHQDKKNNMAGQMSLFDLVSEENKDEFDLKLPNVGEYSKEMKLSFEKEVLGIYVSGHPLEEHEALWKKHITNRTSDFLWDEEEHAIHVEDGKKVTIGGMITDKKIKYTKNNQVMAFFNLEDLVGTVEVVVFPKTYEKCSDNLVEDNKVFITGRVQADDEKDGKLICESIVSFEQIPKKLWIKFATKETYVEKEERLMELLSESEGNDGVVIYIENPKAKKELPRNKNVSADKKAKAALELAKAAGVSGMIGGQVLDLSFEENKPDAIALQDMYMRKTGALLIASAILGCIAAGADEKMYNAAEKYADSIGLAFQIQDDYLDLASDEETLGKPIGSDIGKGKMTIIAIKGLASVDDDRLLEILKAENNSQDEIDEAIEILTNCGAIEYARNLAHESVMKAKEVLEILDDSSSKQILVDIADFVLERSA